MTDRCRFIFLAGLAIVLGAASVRGEDPHVLTDEEKAAGFEFLFHGRDLNGWRHSGNWAVEDGAMAWKQRGGGLVYSVRKIPDDFELHFQWRVAVGSNSGVFYRPTLNEYQILDNGAHADGRNPRTSAASLYFCMPPSHDATKPVGQWNAGRVICKGTVIQHWLNGQKVIDLDYADPQWAKQVELLRKRGGDLTARGGNLMLQDHGDPVWFRAIKLRELGPDDLLDRTPVTPQEISEEVLQAEREKLERILQARQRKAKAKKPTP